MKDMSFMRVAPGNACWVGQRLRLHFERTTPGQRSNNCGQYNDRDSPQSMKEKERYMVSSLLLLEMSGIIFASISQLHIAVRPVDNIWLA
ncbi:hypothetical protein BDW67DRAFT_79840 [Aspergillus spinulosporus]